MIKFLKKLSAPFLIAFVAIALSWQPVNANTGGTGPNYTSGSPLPVNCVSGCTAGSGTSQGAVTTAAPTYTTGTNQPISLTTGGGTRFDLSSVGGSATSLGQKTSAASIPVVVSSDFNLPTIAAQAARTTGNITANGQCISVNATQYSVATIDLTGTYAGITVSFNASTNGGSTYLPVLASNASSTNSAATTAALSNNSSNLFNVTLPGVTNFQVCSTAYTSGTLAVGITPTADPMVFNVAAGIVGTPNVNLAQVNGATISQGNGASGTGVQRVAVASDNTPFPIKIDQTTVGTTNAFSLAQIGSTTILTGGVNGSQGIGGLAANNATQSGNPIYNGATAITSEATNATAGQNAGLVADKAHKLITLNYANPENFVSGCATATGTSDTSVVAAGAGSLKNYITAISVYNSGASTSVITIKNGSGGSTLWQSIAPAGGGSNFVLPTPILTSAATALYFASGTASTTVGICATGYTGL